MEEQVQVCAFVDGKVVVNLIGIADSKKENHIESQIAYSSTSIQNIFSSTKAISSIVIAMLVDRGYLRYDMSIADIWPGNNLFFKKKNVKHNFYELFYNFSIPFYFCFIFLFMFRILTTR